MTSLNFCYKLKELGYDLTNIFLVDKSSFMSKKTPLLRMDFTMTEFHNSFKSIWTKKFSSHKEMQQIFKQHNYNYILFNEFTIERFENNIIRYYSE